MRAAVIIALVIAIDEGGRKTRTLAAARGLARVPHGGTLPAGSTVEILVLT